MIVYRLQCRKGHDFEGWFADSTAYDTQAAAGQVACPVCDSREVTKAPMAPAVSAATRKSAPAPSPAELRQALRTLRRHIEATHENVGARFAEEARRIHHGEAAERGIYGDATPQEVRALADDGIEVAPVPWVPLEDA